MELSDVEFRAVEDVVVLAELTEEIILRVLQIRYEDFDIYTNAGPVLMAVNPFCQVPLYTDKILNAYRKAYLPKLENLPPHPWKTAAKSYIQMFGDDRQVCSLLKPTKKTMRPQSIVVSGESGAGKTETTKIIMAFLAKVSSLNRKRDSLGSIQCKVLEANTILDAVGNARTMRNDNSSRFGKYVKLHFDKAGELVGAGLDTFLLETTRVVRRNQDEERNFHIFYLLCSEADTKQRELLKIRSPDTYTYLNSSGIYDRRDGIQDRDMLHLFKTSMDVLNVEPADMQSLLKCFMAILTVGNIRFKSHTTTAGTVDIKVVPSTQQYLIDTAELLEISPDKLLSSFTTRTMTVADERLSVTLTSNQAEEVRDVFAKTLYSVIFAWLIEFLNSQLAAEDDNFDSFSLSTQGLPKVRRRSRTSSASVKAGIDEFGSRIRSNSEVDGLGNEPPGMIGILDIFGFEKQPENGLEQLLINYANETLQKQYDEVMIDSEQTFYANEKIKWDFIQFPSNKDCIDLIANKQSSVLTLLDEACLAPSGSDSSFIRQVYNGLKRHKRMHLTARIEANNEFCIKHYAGRVVYSVQGFVNKNKNEIFPLSLLKSSSNEFFLRIGESANTMENNKSQDKSHSPPRPKFGTARSSKKFLTSTISNSFKKSVNQLLATLQETQTHYVKCIKPNALNVKNKFMVELVSEQLRCNGIMQTIVVTRCGFPIRFTYEQFHDRYNSLMRALLAGKPYSIRAGVDAVIVRLQEALATGEITLKESVTTLDSISGLQKAIKTSGSADNLQKMEGETLGWGIQRGETRVFLRYNECAALDSMHNITVGVMATNIQRIFRGYKCAQLFRKQKKSAVQISKAYIRFHRDLILMTAILVMQDFIRNVVLVYVKRKKHATSVIARLFYRFHLIVADMMLKRRINAVNVITGWWLDTPWVQNAAHREFIREIFSPVIIPLQQAVRDKLTESRRARLISKHRSKINKPSPSPHRTPKKNNNESSWQNGSPSVQLFPDQPETPPRPPITCRDLIKANSHILWTIFIFYSKEKSLIPGNSVSTMKRNATRLVSAAGMISLLKDWSLVPSLISQYKANNLLKEEMAKDKSPSKLFAFTHFLSFINKLASCFYQENDTRELTDKIKLLDDHLQCPEDVIAVKHLLTVMNTSDGRTKFSQARNAGLIPSFVGVDGSEDALLVYLESQSNSTQNTPQSTQPNHSNGKKRDIKPSFREVDMSEAVQQLMRKNEQTLISLSLRYSPPVTSSSSSSSSSKSVWTTSPTPGSSSKKDSRKSHVLLSLDAVYNCLHDFDVCPILCSKLVLQTLYHMVESKNSSSKGGLLDEKQSKDPPGSSGLSFALFIELLDHVAQNCLFGSKKYTTPEGRVRAMFHHMNSSRGRSKLNRDPNSLIINPLTGLESMDPQLESNSAHRKNVVSKVSARLASTPEKNNPNRKEHSPSPSAKKLPMSHYQHLRTIKTPPRASLSDNRQVNDKPEWNFR